MNVDLLTEEQAASLLTLRPQTLSVWRVNKRYPLPYVKIGGRVRYRRADLERFIAEHTHNTAQEAEAA